MHTVHCFSHKTKRLYETNIFEIKSNAFAKVLSKYLHMHRNGTHIKTFVYAFKCFHAKRHYRLHLNQVKDLYANALAYILFVTYLSYTCTHALCTFYVTTNSFVATTLLVANGAPSSLSSFSSQLRRRRACLKYDLITVGCCELKWSRVDLTGASTSRARSCSETGTCAWNK